MKFIETINSIHLKRRNKSSAGKKQQVFPELRTVTHDVDKREDFSIHRPEVVLTPTSSSSTLECDGLNQKYHIVPNAAGHGVSGIVYPAIHRKTKEVVAVKSIKKATIKRKDRIIREITFLREVDHPNIIKAHGIYEDDRTLHIVTEMCHGGELFDKVVEYASLGMGCFREKDAARIISDLLRAVSYLHTLNIVHRDIKPENILFTEENNDFSPIKLIDFGLSIRHNEGQRKLSTRVGTPYYMAPEILAGVYDRSCDLWSVGVVAFVMLCGRPPFNGCNDDMIFAKLKKGKYNMDTAHWSGISEDAKDFVRKLLQMEPAKRMTADQALEHPWLVDNKMGLD